MFPLSIEEIKELKITDIELLCKLDDCGCFANVNESFLDYQARLIKERVGLDSFLETLENEEKIQIFDGLEISKDKLITSELVNEATEVTRNLYDFEIDYIPGFFLSKNVGLLWGGCSLYDEENSRRVFLLRNVFKSSQKWFIYNRKELLAHELCHGARQLYNDNDIEEYFAYQTSDSKFRRYMGNCFINELDALIFILPTFILLAAQIVNTYWWDKMIIWPFWLLTIAVVIYFLIRNQLARNVIKLALKKLKSWKIDRPMALLFRLTKAEILELNKLGKLEDFKGYLKSKASSDIRFLVITHKWKIDNNEGEL